MVEYLRFKSDANTTLAEVYRQYQTDRDLLDYIENKANGSTVSKYDYSLDTLGRRTAVVYTGSAFGSGHHNDYGYNDRSELTAADRKTGTTPNSGDFMSPGNYDFNYDNIGNRLEFGLDEPVPPTPTTYTANDLNEYAGTAEPAESFTYDDDGNLTADGTYAYTWDAENRLIQVVTKRAGDPENGDKKLLFAYDYMGRRVFKRVQVYNSGTSTWQLQGTLSRKVIYDGWNPVLVVRGPDGAIMVRKYTWGLDMSQSIHGAGGIGGLLAVEETGSGQATYWFLYDGNGNVGQILDATDHDPASDITRVAHYEYDPYGNVIVKNNDVCDLSGNVITADAGYANANPMRFSTKWFDDELAGSGVNGAVGDTGLGYWGYRYYSPRLGRWLNRDPIEEAGGLNLYASMGNDPMSRIDPSGDFIGLSCTPWVPAPAGFITGWRQVFTILEWYVRGVGWRKRTFYVASLTCTRNCVCSSAWGTVGGWWTQAAVCADSTSVTWFVRPIPAPPRAVGCGACASP